MKRRFWHFVFLRLPRFFLYCLAIATGVGGLLYSGIPILKYAAYRLAGNDSGVSMAFNYSFDRHLIIVVLSFMLLILVDIGYAISSKLHSPKAAEAARVDARSSGLLVPSPKETSVSPPGPSQAQEEINVSLSKSGQTREETAFEKANQKLAVLVDDKKDTRLS